MNDGEVREKVIIHMLEEERGAAQRVQRYSVGPARCGPS